MVSVERSAVAEAPHIDWKHIDGPLLSWCGMLHWLTLKERLFLFVGLTDADKIAAKRFSVTYAMLKAREVKP